MSNTDLQNVEARFIELYKEGLRPPVILEMLSNEFPYSVHTLYKRLNTKELKKKAEE